VPGLLPALRGERRNACIQLAAVLVPVALLLLAGGVPALGRWGFLVVFGWSLSPFQEAQRSMDTPEPFRTGAAWLFCLGPALLLSLGLHRALAPPPALTFAFTVSGSVLPGTHFTVERETGPLAHGSLVAFQRDEVRERLSILAALIAADGAGEAGPHPALQRYEGYLRTFAFFASPVVALEGELLTPEGAGLRVDGVPSTALPIAAWPRAPLAQALAGARVPADHLLVWDWVPYPQDHALHLTLIPREAVLGRITQALLQGSPPVEIAWPEDARVPRPNQEAP